LKTAIFLGAGASAAEGAPQQNSIFKRFFEFPGTRTSKSNRSKMETELRAFFKLMFQIDPKKANAKMRQFPTFEEILGLLDMAERRQESFKGCGLEAMGGIRHIRQHLVMAMAKTINDCLHGTARLHKELIEGIVDAGLQQETFFLTTNYDILIDNALGRMVNHEPPLTLDYGVEFTNFDNLDGDWQRPGPRSFKLFKLHGSLNWLFCRACNRLTLTPYEKGVIKLLDSEASCQCSRCGSVQVPIIVPPTFFKDMSNIYLGTIWNKAEQSLHAVERIIFCGYSFPDADIHIKYLLKRAQTNRNTQLTFTVINNHPGKASTDIRAEKLRYNRFLGPQVNYTKKSFEDFVRDPKCYMQ
jgi:NAD-dependent SIR2 family protein deacetylase